MTLTRCLNIKNNEIKSILLCDLSTTVIGKDGLLLQPLKNYVHFSPAI